MRVYLAHGKSERARGKAIQENIEKMGIEVFNPFYSVNREDILSLDAGVLIGNAEKGRAMAVVDSDLEGIRKSDIIVCVYPNDVVTIGVPCEMMYASMLNLPIISVAKQEILEHPWVMAFSDGLFTDIEDLYLYLKTLSGNGDYEAEELMTKAAKIEERRARKKEK